LPDVHAPPRQNRSGGPTTAPRPGGVATRPSSAIDAERFLANIESAKNTSSFVDPGLSKITLGEWAEIWLARQAHLKESSRKRYAGILREHIIPVWGKLPLANGSHADVQAWVTQLAARRSAATTKKAHRVFSLILDLAVRGGRLPRNVAQKIDQPAADGPGRAALCDHPAGGAVQRQNRRSACGFGWRPR